MFKKRTIERNGEKVIQYNITKEYEERIINGENIETTELLPDGNIIKWEVDDPDATVEVYVGRAKKIAFNSVRANEVTVSSGINVSFQNDASFKRLTLLENATAYASPACTVKIDEFDDNSQLSLMAELPSCNDTTST